VPVAGRWTMLLNSDDHRFGGGGIGTAITETEAVAAHGHDSSLLIDVPPLAACFFAPA
jgi:1,4-alpha-glucan branching enzyme